MIKHYKELIAWQKAMVLVREIYQATAAFPDREKFGLISQLRRAAVSIPSNIAEGQGRSTKGEFKQFLGHARGSLYEVETQLIIAHDLGFIEEATAERIHQQIAELGRVLHGLIRSLSDK